MKIALSLACAELFPKVLHDLKKFSQDTAKLSDGIRKTKKSFPELEPNLVHKPCDRAFCHKKLSYLLMFYGFFLNFRKLPIGVIG